MVNLQPQLIVNTTGQIIAFNVPEDVFMRDYAEQFCEWIDGTVIKMSPIHDKHDALSRYLATVLDTYFAYRPIGVIRQEPFVMRLSFEKDKTTKRRNREPDIQLISNKNKDQLTETYMNGAADIVIEIVSPESSDRDYGEKFHEYEQAGVQEYWIIDPLLRQCRFYRLNEQHAYVLQEANDIYRTPILPDFNLDVGIFWQQHLPKPPEIVKNIQVMLDE